MRSHDKKGRVTIFDEMPLDKFKKVDASTRRVWGKRLLRFRKGLSDNAQRYLEEQKKRDAETMELSMKIFFC